MKSSGCVRIKIITGAHGDHLARKRKSEDSLKILPEEPHTKYRKLEKGNGQNIYQRKEKIKIKDRSIPHICHEPTSQARVNFFWPV